MPDTGTPGGQPATSADVVIIGGGPGGYVAAIRAAQLGLSTVCVEQDKTLGGTCVNVGCIPSKALLTSSEHFEFTRTHAADHGVVAGTVTLDLPRMMKRKDDVVGQNTKGIEFLFRKNKITWAKGRGVLRRGAGGVPDGETVGHQANRPSAASAPGSSTGTTTSITIRTATAVPIPSSRTLIRSVIANGTTVAIITRPAPTVAAAVWRTPRRTASPPSLPLTYSSRVRISSSVENTTATQNAIVNTLMIVTGSR